MGSEGSRVRVAERAAAGSLDPGDSLQRRRLDRQVEPAEHAEVAFAGLELVVAGREPPGDRRTDDSAEAAYVSEAGPGDRSRSSALVR